VIQPEPYEVYDNLAEVYGDPFIDEAGEQLIRFSRAVVPGRLLDVGAGRGAVAKAALAAGFDVSAIDRAPAMVRMLARECPAVRPQAMSADELDFADGAFDIVVAGYVLDLLPDPGRVFGEIHRVLRGEGILAYSEPSQVTHRWLWLHEIASRYFARPDAASMQADHHRMLETLAHSAKRAGFTMLERLEYESPLLFADETSAWRFLQKEGGLARATRELPPSARSAFAAEVMSGLLHMTRGGAGITVDRGVTLFRAIRL
jgi:ubiquinone/menaquinone biosynthesis C-methylase UbiE